MSKEILLTITMLVSDREETILKCLKSLKQLLDSVPSELIVVDTAGNQTCMEIVRQYTDKIVEFTWCNDFAAARNAGVQQAQGLWVMYLDDDEWFENTKELEAFFLSGDFRNYNSATYIQRNYNVKDGSSWRDVSVGRLVKREKNTRFYGKIHESMPFSQPIRHLNDYVHHYGYIFESKQKRIEHSWRNIKPLLEMRKENPKDYHTMLQLVQEYVMAEEYFSAIEISKEMRKGANCWNAHNRETTYAAITEMKLYVRQNRYEDGYQVGKEILEDKKASVLARACIHNQMVGCCFELKKYDEAISFMELFEESLKEWEEYPDKQYLDCLGVSEDYLVAEELGRFTMLRLHIHVLQEEWEEASAVLLSVNWENDNLRFLVNTVEDVISTLKKADFNVKYAAALENILKKENLKESMYAEADKAEGEEQFIIAKYFSLLPPEDATLCKYHLMDIGKRLLQVDSEEDKKKLEESFKELFKRVKNPLQLPEYIFAVAAEQEIDLEDCVLQVPFDLWKASADTFCAQASFQKLLRYEAMLEKIRRSDNIRWDYFWIKAAEAGAICSGQAREFTELERRLFHFVERSKELYGRYYQPGAFLGEMELLPPACRFAVKLEPVLAARQKADLPGMRTSIKECYGVYPPMEETLTCYGKLYAAQLEEQLAAKRQITGEMQELAAQVKEKIKLLREQGKAKEALLVCGQLRSLLPEDEEIAHIEQVLKEEVK